MTAETEFRELVDRLISDPKTAYGLNSKPKEVFVEDDPIFDSYCQKAVELVRTGSIDVKIIYDYLKNYPTIRSLDAQDYLTDLLRIASNQIDDLKIQQHATEEHLKVLLQESFRARSQSIKNDDKWMRIAMQDAKRGLKIVESTKDYSIDPNIHAELLLALGRVYARPQSPLDTNIAPAFEYYLQALELKEKAGITNDVLRLHDLLTQMINFVIPFSELSDRYKGTPVLRNLEMAHKAALKKNDLDLISRSTEALCYAYSRVRQPQNAEEIARNYLSTWGEKSSEEERDHVRFALASSLSEQGKDRISEAIEIQESLIKESPILADKRIPHVLWRNYGNSLKVAGRIKESNVAYKKALEYSKTQKKNE